MTALLLTLLFWTQGMPPAPQQTGKITGLLKDSAGKPAVNIRVTAVARPESVEDITAGGATLSGLVPTDSLGRYMLDGIPPGRYLVAAGRVDFPTYYPGTQAMVEGKMVIVKAGETTSGIDFTLKDSSGGQLISAGTGTGGLGVGFNVPLDIQVQNGKIPVFGGGKVSGVRATPTGGGNSVFGSATESYLSLPVLTTTDFRLSVEGLPDGYSVKSIKYGSTPVPDGILKLNGVPAPVQSTLSQYVAGMTNFGNGVVLGGTAIPQTLTIVLERAPTPMLSGVMVSGQFPPTIRGAFLSGVSAAIYSDRSYEFFGVQPGLHALIATGSSQTASAASIIIGNQDIKDIELEETTLAPLDIRKPVPPRPAGNRAPGRLPLAAARGKIVDAETGEPLTLGDVFLLGDYWVGRPLNAEGKFEFGKLLPGRYEIEVKAVGYPTFRREFQIDEKDIDLELKSN